MAIGIREANSADTSAIARVLVDSTKTTYADILSAEYLTGLSYTDREVWLNRVLTTSHPATGNFVAETDRGEIVGFARGGLEAGANDASMGELHIIYILDEYQRIGLGRRLVSAVAAKLLSNDIGSMLVWVLEDNRPARQFFESLGGKVISRKLRPTGGMDVTAVSYGWSDIAGLADNAKANC